MKEWSSRGDRFILNRKLIQKLRKPSVMAPGIISNKAKEKGDGSGDGAWMDEDQPYVTELRSYFGECGIPIICKVS